MIFLADDTWQSWWTIYNQWHDRKHIIFISLRGEPCHLLPLFADKLMPSPPKGAKTLFAECVCTLPFVLGAPQFFPIESSHTPLFFLTVFGLGGWWGQPMICSNFFRFWSCLHYKCLRLCCSDPATFLRVWAWLAWLRQQTAPAFSARPSFTGLSIA